MIFDKKYLKNFPFMMIMLGPLILMAYPIFAGKALFWGTPALQFIPWWTYTFDRILAGGLPFINSLNGMGAPLVANYQLAIFYPFTWLIFPFYWLGDVPLMAWSVNLSILIHLWIGGIGMGLLIKKWSGKPVGIVVGGLAYCLSGYWVSRLSFFSMIWCGAWIPWIMLAVTELLENGESQKKIPISKIIKLIIVLSMQLLSGHAQLTWYSNLLVAGWIIVFLIWNKNKRQTIRNMVSIGIAYILAVGITSIQLIPTTEYLLHSQRSSSLDYTKALSASFWPWHLLNFITPDLFGSPTTGDYWGYYAYWEDAVYIGIIPFMAALTTILYLFKKNPKDKHEQKGYSNYRLLFGFGWIVIIITVVLSMGFFTPIFPFLFEHIPTFNLFNAPSRMMVIVIFLLSWFSGLGISMWEKPEHKQRAWLKRIIAIGFSILIGVIGAKIIVPSINPTVFLPVIIFAVLMIAGILIILFKPVQPNHPIWISTIIILTIIDLLLPSIRFNPLVDINYYQRSFDRTSYPEYEGRVFISPSDEYLLKFTRYLKFKDFSQDDNWELMRSALLPNINMLDGIYSANNFDPLVEERYQKWLDQFDQSNQEEKETMLWDMDVSTIIETDLDKREDGTMKISLNKEGLVRWASCAIDVDSKEALRQTIQNHSKESIIIENQKEKGKTNNCQTAKTEINITKLQAEEIIVNIKNSDSGWIWISNIYYPGWEINIDGQPSVIKRVNYLFFGAEIIGGSHLVEFVYHPYSFYWGLAISIFSLCVVTLGKIFSEIFTKKI